jgi:hypothetical protein|nr:MAG TPA: hypothetical protein [Caudoviricetes sp.]
MDLQVEKRNKQYILDTATKTYTVKATEDNPLLYNSLKAQIVSDEQLPNQTYTVVINGENVVLKRNEDLSSTTNVTTVDNGLREVKQDLEISIPETPANSRLLVSFLVDNINGTVTQNGDNFTGSVKFVKTATMVLHSVRKGRVTVSSDKAAESDLTVLIEQNGSVLANGKIPNGQQTVEMEYTAPSSSDVTLRFQCDLWKVKTVSIVVKPEAIDKEFYIHKSLSNVEAIGKKITAFTAGSYKASCTITFTSKDKIPNFFKGEYGSTVISSPFKSVTPDRATAEMEFVVKAGDVLTVTLEGGQEYRINYFNISLVEAQAATQTSPQPPIAAPTQQKQSSVIRLPFAPDTQGYTVKPSQSSYRRYGLRGGAGRYVRDLKESSYIVQCQWTVGPEKYKVLSEVYELFCKSMSPLEMYLYVNGLKGAELQKCKCYFVPDTFQLASVSGWTYVISAQLEVFQVYDRANYKEFQKYGIDYETLPYLDVGIFKHIYKGSTGANALHFGEMLDGVYNGFDNRFIPMYATGIRVVKQIATNSFMNATLQFVMSDATDAQKRNLLRFTFGQYNHEAFKDSITFGNLAHIANDVSLLKEFVTIKSVDEYITKHKLDGVAAGAAKNDAEKDLYYRMKQMVIRSYYLVREMKLSGEDLHKIVREFYEYE